MTATGTGSPITITELTDGTSYTVTVTAANAIGTGPASSPSARITSAPTVVRLALARGLTARGVTAPGWHCIRKGVVCTHRNPLAAGGSLTYDVRVYVGTRVGARAASSARVTPGDATPSDNLGTTTAIVIRRR